MMELPTITGSTYTSNSTSLARLMSAGGATTNTVPNVQAEDWHGKYQTLIAEKNHIGMAGLFIPQKENIVSTTRRFIQVLIVDPDENVPLDQCVLYQGQPKMTDSTDQELYFEIDIKKVLDEHNAQRIKLIDKKVKERTEYLEPARIRDLKMVVVNIAQF